MGEVCIRDTEVKWYKENDSTQGKTHSHRQRRLPIASGTLGRIIRTDRGQEGDPIQCQSGKELLSGKREKMPGQNDLQG